MAVLVWLAGLRAGAGSGVYEIVTLAGGPRGYVGAGATNGYGPSAKFADPSGLAVDDAGNIYVADCWNHAIRKITPAGLVTTLAGNPNDTGGYVDGTGSAARFESPRGVAVDSLGNVYVADTWNNLIRKITPAGVVTTLAGAPNSTGRGSADGVGSDARFNLPSDIAVNADGILFVADANNNTIRRITPEGVVTTFAGAPGPAFAGSNDGVGGSARFSNPQGICVDRLGNLYVSDTINYAIRKITPDAVVTTIAGKSGFSSGWEDGTGTEAQFNFPTGITVSPSGDIFVADRENHTIRRVTPEGVVTTFAGKALFNNFADGHGADARFDVPFGVASDSAGNIYVGDTIHQLIRKISPSGDVTTLAGTLPSFNLADGMGFSARFRNPWGIAFNSQGNLIVCDGGNSLIREVTPDGLVRTIAGDPGNGVRGTIDGPAEDAVFRQPAGCAVDSKGNIFVSDAAESVIRKISVDGQVTTFAGARNDEGTNDGYGSAARFFTPSGLAIDKDDNLYVADMINSLVRKITPDGYVTTIAGAPLFWPKGIAVDGSGNVFVGDLSTVVRISAGGVMTTLAGVAGSGNTGWWDGTGAEARFSHVSAIAVDESGNLFVADGGNHLIRKVTQDGVVTTILGGGWYGKQGIDGNIDGVGSHSRLAVPEGITVDDNGVLYIADTANNTIRIAIELPFPPVIRSAPTARSAGRGRSAMLAVDVGSDAPVTYQWKKDGVGIPGSSSSTLWINSVTDADAGSYTVTISNAGGTVTSEPALVTVTDPPQLINLSARAVAGSGEETLIVGFYIAGTGSKTLLIRGIGPKLLDHGVTSVVENPSLTLYSGSDPISSNDDWDESLSGDFGSVGAFPLDPGSNDAAMKVTLSPGAYTVHLVNTGTPAEGLVELYDFSRDEGTRLVNLSSRLRIGAGETIILGASVIGAPESVVIRNVGPGLSSLANSAADTFLRVFRGQEDVASNDDWNTAQAPYFTAVGAFPLEPQSKDAALQVLLQPGGTTLHATTIGTGGVALVEIYESP